MSAADELAKLAEVPGGIATQYTPVDTAESHYFAGVTSAYTHAARAAQERAKELESEAVRRP